ncbi:hypothetical protein Esi_0313_0015 [Ectocarpus siliculosus]|uniref:Uncharacterized protein n=1 Tax=Ectocarpus siliculosus TaxID=2880 RepID=D7FWU2_ECTSI|nr:hypothetical protein Esi_0313_0015 [Ectocarpus siliculosus]|eukprot:CBJ32180.1 hypothetical protein Esi_0313_0015 [Ectocarpus siliculosus]
MTPRNALLLMRPKKEDIVEVKKTRAEETLAGGEEPFENGKKTATAEPADSPSPILPKTSPSKEDGSASPTATSVDASALGAVTTTTPQEGSSLPESAPSADGSASSTTEGQGNSSRGGDRHAGCNFGALQQRFPKTPI